MLRGIGTVLGPVVGFNSLGRPRSLMLARLVADLQTVGRRGVGLVPSVPLTNLPRH